MIYEFEHLGEEAQYLLLSGLMIRPEAGVALFFSSVLGIFLYWRNCAHKSGGYLNKLALSTSTLALAGSYIFYSKPSDEMTVGLEHAYNLYHHGMFSFSPERLVDGTPEILYFLLLTPFASDPGLLFQANWGLGFLIAWAHLFLLWRLISHDRDGLKLLLLVLFTLSPLIAILASGYGNSLVSLLFFLGVHDQFTGRGSRANSVAIVLPLLRPDAIVYSLAIFTVDVLRRRQVPYAHILLTGLSLFTYFAFVKLYYGHWILTPILFKSVTPGMVAFLPVKRKAIELLTYLDNPYRWFFAATLCTSFVYFRGLRTISTLHYYFAPLAGIFLFFFATAWNPVPYGSDYRYFVGFELFVAICPLLCVQEIFGQRSALALRLGQIQVKGSTQ